ncbi:hypothetical protein KGA65_17485 [Ideonella sp. B7]|uniref:Stf0 family sulfotransferase n=1 Tax=Ideonella benzenivorans TaxID=2831643 RepID=UPI001CED4450|nr:Stf0 family sulfotransferase [Ideonella benzenivorans]MCA6218331.1 hypothetical protein [Ideonella benzenivorans]
MKPSCLISNFGEHYPDVHAKALLSHFGSAKVSRQDNAALAKALELVEVFYVICFTNRCGSHFLAQALASDGQIKCAGEVLNADVVIHHAKERGLASHAGYLAWMVNQMRSKEGYAGVKASVGQLISLYNVGLLSALGPRLRLIHLLRDDLLGQAISLHIAAQTAQWTSLQTSNGARVRYDAETLLGLVASLSSQNSAFQALFQLWGVEPLTVHYEGFAADPARKIKRIGRYLGLPDLQFIPEQITYARQATAKNDTLKNQLLTDLALPIHPRKR